MSSTELPFAGLDYNMNSRMERTPTRSIRALRDRSPKWKLILAPNPFKSGSRGVYRKANTNPSSSHGTQLLDSAARCSSRTERVLYNFLSLEFAEASIVSEGPKSPNLMLLRLSDPSSSTRRTKTLNKAPVRRCRQPAFDNSSAKKRNLIPAEDPNAHARQLDKMRKARRESEAEAAKPPLTQTKLRIPQIKILKTPFIPASRDPDGLGYLFN
jgi:hypothetical protein